MKIEIHPHDLGNRRLWGLVGGWLLEPAVHKALGGYVVSTQGCIWYVAVSEPLDELLGFCMARMHRNGKVVMTYAYVVPCWRGQDVYSGLFAARLQDVLSWPGVKLLEMVVNEKSAHMAAKHGFAAAGKRGEFIVMHRSVA